MSDGSPAVLQEQTRILYEGTWQTLVAAWLVAVVLVEVQSPAVADVWRWPWYMLIVTVYGLRALAAARFGVDQENEQDARHRLRIYRFSVAFTGLAWGAGSTLFLHHAGEAGQVFSVLILVGITTGSLSVLAPDYISYRNQAALSLAPMSLYCILLGDPYHLELAGLLLLLLVFLLKSAKRLEHSFLEAISLSHEKQLLVRELDYEKKCLDSRLGRILQDGSAEIYVVRADTLEILQANTGAAEHLGYTQEQLQNSKLLDILDGFDSNALARTLQPLQRGELAHIHFHASYRRKDNSSYPVNCSIQLSEEEGTPLYIVTCLDISEQEAAAHRAAQQESMTRIVLASAPVYLWAVNMDGKFTFVDGQAFSSETGFQMPRVGDNIFTAFRNYPHIQDAVRRALSGETFFTEVEVGGRTFESHHAPLLRDNGKVQGAIGTTLDISERKEHEAALMYKANFDELTDLPNRAHMLTQLQKTFTIALAKGNEVGLMFIDLDNFKTINDTLGHKQGDLLLQMVAAALRSVLRPTDLAARLSGDEFLVMVNDLHQSSDAELVADKILKQLQQPFALEGREAMVTASMGLAIFPQHGDSPDTVLRCADTAMYQAKTAGRNNYCLFDEEMQRAADRRRAIESRLRRALEKDEFTLLYQPKVHIPDNSIVGAEALLRWDNHEMGRIPPDEFIPIAEEVGLINEVGEWVLNHACEEALAWQQLGAGIIPVAVNVSSRQFRGSELLACTLLALERVHLSTDALELEITEGLLVEDAPETLKTLERLREAGVALALDDFGTGYSSLSYLKRFPLQTLKIDKSFVQDLGRDRSDEALVDAIVSMANSLDLKVVAEGVETEGQLEYVKLLGVQRVQGYYFSAPVTGPEFQAMLNQQLRTGPLWPVNTAQQSVLSAT